VSDRGEDIVPKRRERHVLSLRQGQAIRVDADVATPLELVAKVNCGPHTCAEGRRGNSATLEVGPIHSLVCPFVEEVGEAILTICVIFFERHGLRCDEMARWGRCSGCTGPLLPDDPVGASLDGTATEFGMATFAQKCALACKRKTRLHMSRPPGVVPR
jgi:hypothetical protein